MHLSQTVGRAAALLGLARRQFLVDSSAFQDPETGLSFASYTSDRNITYRVAIPDPIPTNTTFDMVLQIVSPNDVGWAGWAWGGHMTYNPLAVAWANGTNNVVVSSRIASGYFSPPADPDAKYTIFKTGTHLNATHWQVTAKCTGCSRWGDEDTGYTDFDPTNQPTLAYAYSNTPVDHPDDEASTFSIHDSLGHPVYDLSVAKNADFAAKLERL